MSQIQRIHLGPLHIGLQRVNQRCHAVFADLAAAQVQHPQRAIHFEHCGEGRGAFAAAARSGEMEGSDAVVLEEAACEDSHAFVCKVLTGGEIQTDRGDKEGE